MHGDRHPEPLIGFATADMVRESIEYLKQNEPEEGYFVGFSGGKDSIVTLTLCEMAGVKHKAYFSCTRIDPPEVYPFIKTHYPQVEWLYPKESLWELIQKKGPPFRHRRWCCDELKKKPAKNIQLYKRVFGIRAEESSRRAARGQTSQFGKITMCKPIFKWKEWHVWDFIDTHGLAYPELYDTGEQRLGCVVCPLTFANKRKTVESQRRYKGVWKAFEHAVHRWFDAQRLKPDKAEKYANQTWESFWDKYSHGKGVFGN